MAIRNPQSVRVGIGKVWVWVWGRRHTIGTVRWTGAGGSRREQALGGGVVSQCPRQAAGAARLEAWKVGGGGARIGYRPWD